MEPKMKRKWLTVNGQIIDMEETQPAPPQRPRRRPSAVAVANIVMVGCILLEFALGVYFMAHYGILSGLLFHVATVIMAAMALSTRS